MNNDLMTIYDKYWIKVVATRFVLAQETILLTKANFVLLGKKKIELELPPPPPYFYRF